MEQVTVFLAITDFLPVIIFGIGSLFLLRIGYQYLDSGNYTAMAGGAVLCFTGGLYKAASKLLEATYELYLPALQSSQFIMLAPGFTLLFIASIGLLKGKRREIMFAAAPAMELWKIPFIAVMSLANIGYLVVLAIFSMKIKYRSPAILYLLSTVTLLLMSYLSTRPMTLQTQWVAQGVNSVVQLFAALGHYILYRHLIIKNKNSVKGM
jgi:hypothetical protein